MQVLLAIALLHLLAPVSCNDTCLLTSPDTCLLPLTSLDTCSPVYATLAYNIGGNVMYQLSKILSPEECYSFYTKITGTEENVVLKLEQLSEGNNPIHSRKQRAITNPEQCQKILSHWLDSKGDSVYWDHLIEALQAIGRSDVSIKHLGKNLSQDKNLETEKDVEECNKMVQRKTSSLHLENKTPEEEQLRQDKESTKLLSDPGNSEQLKLPKTESLPSCKISININITFLHTTLIIFLLDILSHLLIIYYWIRFL